jgi:hypothetical protein
MGKLTALIVGYVSVTFASYVVLSVAYSPLINWLGPYFGFRFPFILGIIYLIAGSPLRNTIILETWIVLGVIVGISARKGLRAWGSASLIFTLITATFSILLLGMLGISLLGHSGLSGLSGSISNVTSSIYAALIFVPYGTNLATIAMEPVLRQLIPFISSALGSGTASTGTATSAVEPLIEAIAYNAFENYLIFVITSILVGTISYRVLHGNKKKSKKAMAAVIAIFIAFLFVAMAFSAGATSQSQVNAEPSYNSPLKYIPAFAMGGLFPVTISNGAAKVNQTSDTLSANISNGTNEAGLSLITPDGNLYNFYAMENSKNNGNWNSAGLMFGSVVISANMTSLVAREYNINISKFGAFVPDNFIILAYNSSIPNGNAVGLSTSIGTSMGTSFSHIITLKNITLSGYSINVYIYSSSAGNSVLKSGFMKAFTGDYSGSISSIFSNNERLNNYGPFVMASGYVNESIANKVSGISANINGMYFTAGMFAYEQYFHSSGTAHTYNLSALMHYNSDISFSKSSTLSILGIGYNNGTGNIGSIGNYKFNIYTNNASLIANTPLNTSGSRFTDSTSFSPSSVSVSFNAVFPADISYSTSVTHVSSNQVKITVNITNNDNNTVTEFNASQGAFVKNYDSHNASSLISGKYRESNITILPGHSANFSYIMSLSGVGIYVIPYTNISYNFQGKSFSYQTNSTYITQNKPGYVIAMNSMINQEASQYSFLGNVMFTFSGFALSVIDLILIAIVLLDVFIEVKGLAKLIGEKRGQ